MTACPYCKSTQFEMLTDATVRCTINDVGQPHLVALADWGAMQYMWTCVGCSASLEKQDNDHDHQGDDMKQEIAEKWREALLSGEFEQGQRALKLTSGQHCCLGVLCALYTKETGKGEWTPADVDDVSCYSFETRSDSSTGVLPTPVREWAGMHSDDGAFSGRSLMYLNDEGKSFEEIAAVIKEHAETL